jgi:small redox-active disulfide protein 2
VKKIQILGPGCAKCKQLAMLAEQAAKEAGVEYTLEKVTDIKDIMKFGVMMTPGLVVDGVVKVVGKVPGMEEMKKLIA